MQRDMEYIRMVYKTGSFSKAAELLFASQPAVSMAVQRVEEELGARIFERGTSPLRPTEAGRRYLAHADRIAQSEDQLRRELDGINDQFHEKLRLGCLPMHTQSLIPVVLARLAADHPDARVSAVCSYPSRLYRMLRDGEVDLAICSMAGADDVDIAYMPAVKEQLLAAIPPDDPVNRGLEDFALSAAEVCQGKHRDPDWPRVPLSAFQDTAFILPMKNSDFYPYIHSVCVDSGFEPKLRYSVSAPILAYGLARHGLGATLLGSLFISPEGDPLRYYRLDTRLDEQTYYYAVRSGCELSYGQRCMIESFRTVLDP